MLAVSATHANKSAARVIARRKAAEYQQKIERDEKATRLEEHIAETVRLKREREEASKRAAEECYQQILAAFHEVELGKIDKRLTVKNIVVAAIKGTTCTFADIVGHSRVKEITRVRQYAILCAWALRPDMSLPQLGRALQRDHTTIIHARNRFGFESRAQAATFIRMHGREATLARLVKRAA